MSIDGLTRSQPCAECGAAVLWTQNAWKVGDAASAAYVCMNGHTIDPTETRQCPNCGVHDTVLLNQQGERQEFRCAKCGEEFVHPR